MRSGQPTDRLGDGGDNWFKVQERSL